MAVSAPVMIAAYKCSKATQKSAVCMQVKEFGGAWVYDEMFLKSQAPGKAMQYIVEVRVSGRDLVELDGGSMRTWLDHQRIEPHGFRHRRDSAQIMIHIDFNSEPDAIGFARAFGGQNGRRAERPS